MKRASVFKFYFIFTVYNPSLRSADSFTCSTCKQQVAALSFPTQVIHIREKSKNTWREDSKLQMVSLAQTFQICIIQKSYL